MPKWFQAAADLPHHVSAAGVERARETQRGSLVMAAFVQEPEVVI
jgi:hypothetical protein